LCCMEHSYDQYPNLGQRLKNHDLLTSGDPDINPICIKYILPNMGVYKQENEWQLVNLFHTVPKLLHLTFALPLNFAHKFQAAHKHSTAILYFASQLGFKVFMGPSFLEGEAPSCVDPVRLSVCPVPPPRGKTKRPTNTKLGRKGSWDTSTAWTNFKVKGSEVKVTAANCAVCKKSP